MDRRPDGKRSAAEALFAEILLANESRRRERFDDLCRTRPELAGELGELWRDLERLAPLERAGPAASPLPAARPVQESGAAPPRIAGYVCTSLVARGGMGEVWEARELSLDRKVALKVLSAGTHDSDVGRERFRREALAAGRVQHPAIVSVFAAGQEGGRQWIAQELVPGGRTLRDLIEDLRRAHAFPPDHERRLAMLAAEVADALEAAHRAGIVHRDLKPANILLTPEGRPKVADFGIARLQGESTLSHTGDFLGTWLYASPEHVSLDRSAIGRESDVWSLGVTLYECLTLQRPFRGETVQEVSAAILYDDPPDPTRLRPRLPRELATICLKALEKRPARRYASMQDFADDLRRFLADEPVLARPPSRLDRARRWGRRHPVRATALVLGSLALVGLAALEWRTLEALDRARRAGLGEQEANARLRRAVDELRASRDEARADREVSDEVLRVLSEIFDAGDPALLGLEEPTMRQLLARGAADIRAGRPESPRARARLLTTLGGLLSSLGDWHEAELYLEEARALWQGLGRAEDPEAFQTLVSLVDVRMSRGDPVGARELGSQLLDHWRAGRLPPNAAVSVLTDMGVALSEQGDLEAGRAAFQEALDVQVAITGAESYNAAYARSQLAQIDYRQGLFGDGLARLEGDVDLLRPVLATGNTIALDHWNMRGLFLLGLGRLTEAESVLAEALDAAAAALGPDHPRALTLRTNLGTVVQAQRRFDEAEALFRESLELSLARFGPDVEESQVAKHDLANCLVLVGRLHEAEELFVSLVEEVEASRGADGFEAAQVRAALGNCRGLLGHPAEAIELLERALPALPHGTPIRRQVEDALAGYREEVRRVGE